MENIYPFIISFIFIFLSELGDKTQLLVLSFSSKNKAFHILLGVALGTLFSHGLAILFGSKISSFGSDSFIFYLKLLTYFTFIIFGIIGFMKLKKSSLSPTCLDSKSRFIRVLTSFFKSCILIVSITIAIGELGDKTFLASIGLGLEYPMFKLPLIWGAICGMVISNSIAIFLGKWLGTKISATTIDILSNTIFILFGIIGFLGFLIF